MKKIPNRKADFFLTLEGNKLFLSADRKHMQWKIDVTPVYLFAKEVFESNQCGRCGQKGSEKCGEDFIPLP